MPTAHKAAKAVTLRSSCKISKKSRSLAFDMLIGRLLCLPRGCFDGLPKEIEIEGVPVKLTLSNSGSTFISVT